jgi:hypothetical protein
MPLASLPDHTSSRPARNQEIRERYAQGEALIGLAAAFDFQSSESRRFCAGDGSERRGVMIEHLN